MSAELAQKRLLPEARAAEYLGISQATLWRYHNRGVGPSCYAYPGRRMYAVADLDAWMETRKQGGGYASS
jgi:predicted DNA-binding transcriptional regulator AlpA